MKGGTRPHGHYMRHKIKYTGCPKTNLPQEMFILRFKMWNPFKIQFKPIAKKMLTHLYMTYFMILYKFLKTQTVSARGNCRYTLASPAYKVQV